MPLVRNTYGKGRVRVMRVHRDGKRHEVRELTIKVILEGGFARAYDHGDNSNAISTDTMKNVVNVVARENLALDMEPFCQVLAKRFLNEYSQVDKATVSAHETVWSRLSVRGVPQPH